MTFLLDGQKVDTKITQAIYRALSVWRLTDYIKNETLGDTVMKIKYKRHQEQF